MSIEPDKDVASEWLHQLFGTAEEGWVNLFSCDATTGARYTDWGTVDQLDQLADTAMIRAKTCDVWHGCGTRRANTGSRRGGHADVLQIPGLWVDVDVAGPNHATENALPPTIEDGLALIGDFRLPPTAVVHSGGGLQPWWLFGEMVDADKAATMLTNWGHTWSELAAARGWHLDNVFELARVMRLPGTINRKNEPTLVRTIGWSQT